MIQKSDQHNAPKTPPNVVARERHMTKVGRKQRRRHEAGERGYVLVVTSILLPVLVLFVALATDVTYLYARSIELQRVADSSALAGVTRMPVESDARNLALQTAKQNGVENDFGGVTVTADAPVGSNRRLNVTVRDRKIPLFFGRIFKEFWDVTRTSTAEYVSNIPLGSALNAIGTGPLTSEGMKLQNFWLSIAGPCAPKELGDQLASRYDGNSINAAAGGNANKLARLCDYDPNAKGALESARLAYMANLKLANPSLFDGLSINRDSDPSGYNYIVEVPCRVEVDGTTRRFPCALDDKLTGELTIQVFDPVFNPDSVQRFNQFNQPIKPDSYGVPRRPVTNCQQTNPVGCNGTAAVGVNPGVNPKDVRVVTDVRVYLPDRSPTYYGDDQVSLLDQSAKPNVVASLTDAFVVPAEANKVLRFGSCVNITDGFTQVSPLAAIPDENYDFIPDAPGGDGVLTATDHVGGEPLVVGGPAFAADPNCAANASQWRTIAVIKGTDVKNSKGRFRLNMRTVSSQNSFGNNGFALRAFFGPTYTPCSSLVSNTCPSVAGDTAMSVFASVPDVSRFYLAKLAPAKEYRGKKIELQLWDPGEGGDSLEVLRPVADMSTCPVLGGVSTQDIDPLDAAATYCASKFNWKVFAPGINETGIKGLDPSGAALADKCSTVSTSDASKLYVSGAWTKLEQTKVAATDPVPCPANSTSALLTTTREGFSTRGYDRVEYGVPSGHTFPAADPCQNHTGTYVNSTTGATESLNTFLFECQSGRFNDRNVTIQITVPQNYGCAGVTGLPGNGVCVEEALPQGGWWKIKYTPVIKSWTPDTSTCVAGKPVKLCSQYIGITDLTTWKVNLVGDPVHLVKGKNP